MEETFSVHEAAACLGKSEATVRRMIKRQELRAFQRTIPGGFEWRIYRADLPDGDPPITHDGDLIVTPDQEAVSNDIAIPRAIDSKKSIDDRPPITQHDQETISDDHPPVTAPSAEYTALLNAYKQSQQQNTQLAGQLGFYQARIQALEEQVRMLTDSQHAPSETEQTQPAEQLTKRALWWKRLFGT